MASRIQSGTVVANTVTTVILNYRSSIEIVNRGTVDMWARVDGVDPTIAGDECLFIAPQGFVTIANPKPTPTAGVTSNSEIRMIAGSNCNYTVAVGY